MTFPSQQVPSVKLMTSDLIYTKILMIFRLLDILITSDISNNYVLFFPL